MSEDFDYGALGGDEEEEDGSEEREELPERTMAEAFAWATDRVEDELEDFEGEDPEHGAKLLVADVGNLFSTLINVELASQEAEVPDERVARQLEEDCVDILLSLAALQHQYDMDIAAAFAERVETIQSYKELEAALEGVETEEEAREILKENMDQLPPQMQMQMKMMEAKQGAMMPPDEDIVGKDVTDDDYDPDDPDRHIQ